MHHLTLSPSLRSIGSGMGVVDDAETQVEVEDDQVETGQRSQETLSGAVRELAKHQYQHPKRAGTCSPELTVCPITFFRHKSDALPVNLLFSVVSKDQQISSHLLGCANGGLGLSLWFLKSGPSPSKTRTDTLSLSLLQSSLAHPG